MEFLYLMLTVIMFVIAFLECSYLVTCHNNINFIGINIAAININFVVFSVFLDDLLDNYFLY